MSFFTKKNFLYKLIICICIVLSIINTTGIKNVYAGKADDGSGIGGVLITPICNLLLGIGDGIMNIIQKSIMGIEAVIPVDNSDPAWWETLLKVVIILIVVAVVVVVAIYAPGVLVAALKVISVTLVKAAIGLAGLGLVVGYGALGDGLVAVSGVVGDALSDTVALPTFAIGPEEIFSGKILLFDANVFNPKQVYVEYEDEEGTVEGVMTIKNWKNADKSLYHATGYYYMDGTEKVYTSVNNSAYELSAIIAKWYYIIRTIALVASMLILVYIGLRIIISSIAEEKAKYKQMLVDWVIALCLIVLMHYIMVFAHNIVDNIRDLFNNTLGKDVHIVVIDEPGDNLIKAVKEIEKERGVSGDSSYIGEGEKYIKWPTNLMGKFRMEAQEPGSNMEHVGFTLAYLALVLLTLIFSFTYIKRLLYLLFLTVIAPFVALTYPIDKIHDGKAQAFDIWLKEYIFNLLIQPFHLLLYIIFVSMAFELASTNVIYSLVVLGFMVPAEKFLRTMFGFNKSSTSDGLFAGAGGAALAMSAVSSLAKFAKGGNGKKTAGDKKDGNDDHGRVRMPDQGKGETDLLNDIASEATPISPTAQPEASNNLNDLGAEGQRLASERGVLDEFMDELTTPGTELNPEDAQAIYELEREQEEAEERLRQRELLEAQQQTENPEIPQVDDEEPPVEDAIPQGQQPRIRVKGNYWKGVKKTFAREFNPVTATGSKNGKEAAKKIIKSGVKTFAGTAFKTAGVVTGALLAAPPGIVSGNAETAFKNITIGAGTGLAVSSGINSRVSSAVDKFEDPKLKEKWERDYYGENYDEAMKQRADDEFMKDKQIRELYAKKLRLNNKQEIQEAMQQAQKYREYGVTDNDIIIKAMKSTTSGTDRTSKERIAAAKFAEKCKTEKDLQTHMSRLNKVPGMENSQQSKDIERLVRDINRKYLE